MILFFVFLSLIRWSLLQPVPQPSKEQTPAVVTENFKTSFEKNGQVRKNHYLRLIEGWLFQLYLIWNHKFLSNKIFYYIYDKKDIFLRYGFTEFMFPFWNIKSHVSSSTKKIMRVDRNTNFSLFCPTLTEEIKLILQDNLCINKSSLRRMLSLEFQRMALKQSTLCTHLLLKRLELL